MTKEVTLKHYIQGEVKLSDFAIVDKTLSALQESEVLVKNNWMSVDPYMRGRMIDRKSYIPPFQLKQALEGSAVGIVQESKSQRYQKGDMVLSMKGWREAFIANERELIKLPARAHEEDYLGVMGMPGMTAYTGLLKIGKPKEGECVFVSAASGAVGSLVCQIAKLKGCKVIASVGSDEKVKWLKEVLGVDEAFNYKKHPDLNSILKKVAANGIDVYFENVGGKHLEAAINHMNAHGRIVVCGMISQYNLDHPEPGPTNLAQIIGKRLLLKGFIVSDYDDVKPEFYTQMDKWLETGKVHYKTHVYQGIDKAPEAFINLFKGENIGKMLVKL
ncbi:NADP-dependent oxidoreductase [Fangia hongkongensis]|uniref:NADP-dependent oxidoreductase n=1 Tax=Fangia hongkongensis TaxID=270495 RepID=UPI000379E8AD|nr:NADP-dependent oxidoreductase [Fangia hongkongensis]MBK2124897.1 NADP-dependent oxidoreductase [Fangia hongkongensis]